MFSAYFYAAVLVHKPNQEQDVTNTVEPPLAAQAEVPQSHGNLPVQLLLDHEHMNSSRGGKGQRQGLMGTSLPSNVPLQI